MKGKISPKLEKLTIDSYSTQERSNATKIGSFEVMFNPSTFFLKYENQYSKRQGINTSAAALSYQYTAPQNLSLALIVDGTNTYKNAAKATANSIQERIKQFLELFTMNGNIHQPPFLKIIWGKMHWHGMSKDNMAFDCRLSSLDITYTLFDRDGTPLRAELNTSFVSDIENGKRVKLENKCSPDLTHIRIITSGSNLPLFSQQIYQNSLLYLEIAKINELDNFRAIKPGVMLMFPPIKQ